MKNDNNIKRTNQIMMLVDRNPQLSRHCWFPVKSKQGLSSENFPNLVRPVKPIAIEIPPAPPFSPPKRGWTSIVLDTPDIWKNNQTSYENWELCTTPEPKIVKEISEKQSVVKKILEDIDVYKYELSLISESVGDVKNVRKDLNHFEERYKKIDNFYECMLKYYEPEYDIEIYKGRYIHLGKLGKKEMILKDLHSLPLKILPRGIVKKMSWIRNYYFRELPVEQRKSMLKFIYQYKNDHEMKT